MLDSLNDFLDALSDFTMDEFISGSLSCYSLCLGNYDIKLPSEFTQEYSMLNAKRAEEVRSHMKWAWNK